MCMSAEASFAAEALLLPAGAYCVRAALRRDRRLLALAAVPCFFGFQQLWEGVVWLGLGREDPAATERAALGFLFFALAFWPFWIPLTALVLEREPVRKRLIGLCTLLSLSWFFVLYYPVASDPQRWLTVRVVHHSIQYSYPDLPVYQVVAPPLLRLLYLATIAVPMALCSERTGLTFGLLLGASAVVSHFVFTYAFVSVWCFFAALLTLYLCVVFYRLPAAKQS